MAVITIFSGSFCHAEEISAGVARELGYEFIDDDFFNESLRQFGISKEKADQLLTGPEPFWNRLTHEREKNIASLRIVLAELIQSDSVIVRSCVGHLIPRTISHVLRLCIIANLEYRLEQAAKETGKSRNEIVKFIHEDDKKNFACTELLFEKMAYDSSLYDIVLPMHSMSIQEAVKTICDHARSDAIATTERSRRAARDFLLSAQINKALADSGLSAEAYSEDGQVVLLINKYVVRLEKYRERLKEAAEKVPGVKSVSTRLGPRYRAQPVNPWGSIEGPPKIMLVDDEKEFVHTLSERLRTRNLESSVAYDGEQALDMLKKDIPDVMVLDLMMPGIDGIEVLRRIKKEHPKVEVIILTGHGSERERQLAEELGAFAYLSKPVDIDLLARVMRDAYSRSGGKSGDSAGAEGSKGNN
jgi:two-component system response regulator CpxR